jgi:hypothetical protein
MKKKTQTIVQKIQKGDRGQRYEVYTVDAAGNEELLGWTNDAEAIGFRALIKDKPEYVDLAIKDRGEKRTGLEVELPFKPGCRKCVDEYMRERNRCSYCNLSFRSICEVPVHGGQSQEARA